MTARVLALLLLIALPVFAQAPPDWDDVRNRADDLVIAQKNTEAIAVLSAYAKTHPRFADAHVRLGDLHEQLASRLAFDPKSAAVRTQHLEAAERAYRRALEIDKGSHRALVGLAEVLGPAGANRPAAAEPVIRQLMARDPDGTFWHRRLAEVLVAAGRNGEAAKTLSVAAVRGSATDRALAATALVKILKDTPTMAPTEARRLADEAVAALSQHIAASPDDADLYAFQADALATRAALESDPAARKTFQARADAAFETHLVRAPAYPVSPPEPGAPPPTIMNPPPGWHREGTRADALLRAGRPADAAAAMEPWIAAYPGFVSAHYSRVLYLSAAGQFAQMTKALAAARAGIAKTAEARRDAVMFLHMIVSMTESLPAAQVRTLVMEARALAEEAIAFAPRDPESLFSKARVLRLQAEHLECQPGAVKALTAEADRLEEQAYKLSEKR